MSSSQSKTPQISPKIDPSISSHRCFFQTSNQGFLAPSKCLLPKLNNNNKTNLTFKKIKPVYLEIKKALHTTAIQSTLFSLSDINGLDKTPIVLRALSQMTPNSSIQLEQFHTKFSSISNKNNDEELKKITTIDSLVTPCLKDAFKQLLIVQTRTKIHANYVCRSSGIHLFFIKNNSDQWQKNLNNVLEITSKFQNNKDLGYNQQIKKKVILWH